MYKKAVPFFFFLLLYMSSPVQSNTPEPHRKKICGQACAFKNAQEAMVALGLYFSDYKQSSKNAQKEERKENVKICLKTPKNSKCKKKDFLDSSLHHSTGMFIRHAILVNRTNAHKMESLGYVEPDKETETNKNVRGFREVEDPQYYSWLYPDEVNLEATDLRLELHERDNFLFPIQELAEAPPNDISSEAMQQVKNYVGPEEEIFSIYRKIKDDSKGGEKDYILEDKKKKDNEHYWIVDKNKYNKQEEAHKKAINNFSSNKQEAIKDSLKEAEEKETEIKEHITKLLNCSEEKDCTEVIINTAMESTILSSFFTEKEKEELHKNSISEELKEKLEKIKDYNPYQLAAYRVNVDIRSTLEQRKKQRDLASKAKESILYTIDMEAFDSFLDAIWPTEEQP